MLPNYVYRATCKRVIDSDTLELSIDLGLKVHAIVPVRLLGIDTPERNTPEGKKATAFVTDLLNGAPLVVETHKDQQTFARWLANVWVHGELLSEILKTAGFEKVQKP